MTAVVCSVLLRLLFRRESNNMVGAGNSCVTQELQLTIGLGPIAEMA
jgi:hypothetical protein